MAELEAVGVDAGTEAIKSFCYCQGIKAESDRRMRITLYLLKCARSAGYGLSRLEFGEGNGTSESYDTSFDF